MLSSVLLRLAITFKILSTQVSAHRMNIESVPDEVLANIGKFLPLPDAARLGSSSKQLNGALDMMLEESIGNVADSVDFQPWKNAKHYAWGLEHIHAMKKFLTRQNSSMANDAFEMAIGNGHLEVVRLLLNDSRVNPNGAIELAIIEDQLEVVRMLLNHPRVDPGFNDNYVFRMASQCGNWKVVQALQGNPRVNPAARNNEAIRMASKYGHWGVVDCLIRDPRVDPEANDNEALRMATENGHSAVVQLLRDRHPTATATIRTVERRHTFSLQKAYAEVIREKIREKRLKSETEGKEKITDLDPSGKERQRRKVVYFALSALPLLLLAAIIARS